MKKLIDILRDTIVKIENDQIPMRSIFITFSSIITLRIFIEAVLSHTYFSLNACMDYYAFFISIALSFVLLFYLGTKEKVEKIIKVLTQFSLLILLAPIIDSIISMGKGYKIMYTYPYTHQGLWKQFFTFFGPVKNMGATPGIRIELLIILIFSFLYFIIKNQKIIKSLFFAFLAYVLIFYHGSLMYILKTLKLDMTNTVEFFLLYIAIISLWVVFFYNKNLIKKIVSDMKSFKLVWYELMFLFGVALGVYKLGVSCVNNSTYLSAIILTISILNVYLYEKNKEDAGTYLFIAAIVYSFSVNFVSGFIILLIIANSNILQSSALNLKKLITVPQFLFSLNSLAIIIMGYLLINNKINISQINFPLRYVLAIIIFITLGLFLIENKFIKKDIIQEREI